MPRLSPPCPTLAVAIVCLVLTFAPGASPAASNAIIDSTLTSLEEEIPGEGLTLEAALRDAFVQAPSLKAAEAAVAAARGTVRREQGGFEPALFGRAERRRDEQPSANFFAGAEVLEVETSEAEAGARITLPLGTEVSASLTATRTETNSTFATLQPQYDAMSELSIRQPLLDGLGAGTRGLLSASERQLEAAEARAQDARLGLQALVETTYWELFAAGRDYAVQMAIIAQARALLEQAQLRSEAGLVGPDAVASARVFLAEQEQARFDRLEDMGALSDRLASLIGHRPDTDDGLFHPLDAPPEHFVVEPSDELVHRAMDANLELRGLERDVERWRELHRAARRNALPTLDLIGGVGGRGLGGDPQDVEFGGDIYTTDVDASAGESTKQALSGDFPNWKIGLLFEVPLGNRGDGGERDRLGAEVARAEQNLEAARRDLEQRVRAQHRVLANGAERLASARRGLEAAQEQVRIGALEFQNGQTTAFELVRLGADLSLSQRRYSDALVRTARATAVLRQLLGGDSPVEVESR